MSNAVLDKQLVVTVNNRTGTLAEVTHVLAASGINILAVCAYAVDNRGVINFVAENHAEAKKLLKAKRYEVEEEDVILVTLDNRPGALQTLTQKVADEGIDLNLIYGSIDKSGKSASMVLITEDNRAVLLALKCGELSSAARKGA